MFSYKYSLYLPIFFLAGFLIIVGCSKNDDQRDFENQALSSQPEGITHTKNAEIIEGKTDPDDWRISPTYSGLIRVEVPAHPNPAAYNSNNIQIDLYIISNLERTNSIEVWAFKNPGRNNIYGPLYIEDDLSSTSSFISIPLTGELIAGSNGGSAASDIYRILIFDENQRNLITYGDIQIQ